MLYVNVNYLLYIRVLDDNFGSEEDKKYRLFAYILLQVDWHS